MQRFAKAKAEAGKKGLKSKIPKGKPKMEW